MLTELEEITATPAEEENMPSFNHSYICLQIIRQLLENPHIEPLPELTLDIGKGLTPDISIYQKETISPNFLKDYAKYPRMPLIAIEVISASQNIQDLLDKSENLVANNIKAVWTVEPFTGTIFVTTPQGIQKFSSQTIESEGIKVDFQKIFG